MPPLPGSDSVGEEARARLDDVIHSPVRLSVVAALAAADEAEFAAVRDAVQISDSALSKAVTALEQAEYVHVRKGYVGKRPRTWLRLTPAGRRRAREARAARDAVVQQATGDLTAEEATMLEGLLDKLVAARVASRIERRKAGESGAWWCRTCDFAACGRPEGRCPAQLTAEKAFGP